MGDGADGGDDGSKVARRIGSDGVDRLLYLSDVYEHGTAEDFDGHYKPVYGQFDKVTAPTILDKRNVLQQRTAVMRQSHGVQTPRMDEGRDLLKGAEAALA